MSEYKTTYRVYAYFTKFNEPHIYKDFNTFEEAKTVLQTVNVNIHHYEFYECIYDTKNHNYITTLIHTE